MLFDLSFGKFHIRVSFDKAFLLPLLAWAVTHVWTLTHVALS